MRKALALWALLLGCQTSRPILVAARGEARPPRPVLFQSVRVFDGASDALSDPSDVLVEGGRIAALGPAGSLRSDRAERVDGRGKTLLPGLVDCHVHLGGGDGTAPWASKRPNVDAQAAALVYSGVTTILAAARDSDAGELRSRIARGEMAGPRIVSSSRIVTARGGHPVGMYKAFVPWPVSSFVIGARVLQVEGEEDARKAVAAEIADVAPEFVKIVYDDIPPGAPHLTAPVLRAIVGAAAAAGRRASVHAGSPAEAIEAIEAGASFLMHVPADAPLDDDQARRIATSAIPIATTVRIYGVLHAANQGTLAFSPLEREVMPPAAPAGFAERPKAWEMPGFPRAHVQSFARLHETMAGNAKKLFDAGARLLAGTDSGLPGVFHGAALHRELQALVALGIPAARVLRMATSEAARAIDPRADYGTIAPGQRADLLLIDGDPLADISATERIAGVWQEGQRLLRRTVTGP